MRLMLSLLLCLVVSPVFSQDVPPTPSPSNPVAVLDGPVKGEPGDLVILSWNKSVGDTFVVLTPESLNGKILLNSTDMQMGFSTRVEGEYTIYVVAINKDLKTAKATKTVLIGRKGIPPPDPDDPTDPTDPVDPPSTIPLAEIKSTVAKCAANVNDRPTAAALAAAIKLAANEIGKATDVGAAFTFASTEIERVLLKRAGTSLKADWLNKWRIPVNIKINEYKHLYKTPADATAVMLAVAEGLSQ